MRLIDADALKRKFRNVNEGMFQLSRVYELIDNTPTVDTYTEDDVQYAIKEGHQVGYEMAKAKYSPKTGHWIWNECQIFCSECREVYFDYVPKDRMNYPLNNFCPNCGAKMTKEEENDIQSN